MKTIKKVPSTPPMPTSQVILRNKITPRMFCRHGRYTPIIVPIRGACQSHGQPINNQDFVHTCHQLHNAQYNSQRASLNTYYLSINIYPINNEESSINIHDWLMIKAIYLHSFLARFLVVFRLFMLFTALCQVGVIGEAAQKRRNHGTGVHLLLQNTNKCTYECSSCESVTL